ncbi:hypothetical protein VCHA53O466_50352 [Vibrio chagasii]|nr:hypothetical protein VCHA53O466_50352 [Vibrio chagasii]
MKKTMYIHGAFSAFKPDSQKVLNLKKAFDVVGCSYSMEDDFNHNREILIQFARDNNVDFIVGTSLGGLYASEVGNELSLPSVLINPCVEPVMSLSTIIGEMTNFATGKKEILTQELVNTFPIKAKLTRRSLVFVGLQDELIDAQRTYDMYSEKTSVLLNYEEDHYWEDFEFNEGIVKHFPCLSETSTSLAKLESLMPISKPKWISIEEEGYPSVLDTYPDSSRENHTSEIKKGNYGYRSFLLKNSYKLGSGYYFGGRLWSDWHDDEAPTHYAIIEGF